MLPQVCDFLCGRIEVAALKNNALPTRRVPGTAVAAVPSPASIVGDSMLGMRSSS